MPYPHPEQLYAELTSGSPAGLEVAGKSLTDAMANLDNAGSDVDAGRKAVGDWRGVGADAFAERMSTTTQSIEASRQRLGRAQRTLDSVAAATRSMRGSADEIIGFYRSMAMFGVAKPEFEQRISQSLMDLRVSYNETLTAHAETIRGLKPAFERTASGSAAWRKTRVRKLPPVPYADTKPARVTNWWNSLTEDQRDQLLATEYDKLGRLDGLPADVLDTANRRRIEVDQQTFAAQAAGLNGRIQDRAEQLGIDPRDENALRESNDRRLASLLDQRATFSLKSANATKAADNLTSNVDRHAADVGSDAYVLSYSPEGPGRMEGALAVAFGDPDTADNVAVTVPGTGSTVGSDFTGQASSLKSAMDENMPGQHNATVAWLGYDAPAWDWSVADDSGAKEGGQRLVQDVNGYRAAAEAAGTPNQHMTVVGHSYGSATVGYAGMNGLAADDIALVGSPGAGASEAGELSAGPGHVWAGGNEHDPVIQGTNGTYFTEGGADTGPYDPDFGAHQFATDGAQGIGEAHSAYYDGESLENLGRIATGDYGDVTQRDPSEAPVAPDSYDSGNLIVDTVVKAQYQTGQAAGHVLDGDFGEAAQDMGDLGVSTLGTVAEEGGEVVKDAAGALTGLLF